jgi:large subunit ribosomal protein L2
MGKTITSQARGHGSMTWRVKRKAYIYRIGYPKLDSTGKAKIIKLLNSSAHSSPIAKILINKESFYVPAINGIFEGQEIDIGDKIQLGNIVKLKDIPQGTRICNLESYPGSGGKYLRSAGCSGVVTEKKEGKVEILIARRKLKINPECRAIIGVVAGDGRKIKPLVKAGKKHYIMKAKGKKWHLTSAIKTNALDHPFGSGRGKRIKSKIAKRNAPPGAKVGHIRPRRTGRVK